MMELQMETEIDHDVREEGGLWYVFILDRRVGRGAVDKHAAEALNRWVGTAMQDIVDVFADVLDKAWKEQEAGK
jgi:hypothetical protein